MNTFAAVMTGKGTGAISTIQVFGGKAEPLIKKIFKPAGSKSVSFKTGKILVGTICEGKKTIDQVTIGCEGVNSFAINCHGNPLLVEMIMKLLRQNGAKLLSAEQMLCKILSAEKSVNAIELEAKLSQVKARTIEGTKIIVEQIDGGLNKIAAEWLTSVSKETGKSELEKIKGGAGKILAESRRAKFIIEGCRAALIGPPNSGKSTLLNCLAGRDKSIVADIKGTTRDWVSAGCRIGPVFVEFIDTAGLDGNLSADSDSIEKAVQKKTCEILENADLLLLVLDNSQPEKQLERGLAGKIAGRKILTILIKSDLTARLDAAKLPEMLRNTVKISAKNGDGINNLLRKIIETLGAADFDLKQPVCFTGRQKRLLKQLTGVKSAKEARITIRELL